MVCDQFKLLTHEVVGEVVYGSVNCQTFSLYGGELCLCQKEFTAGVCHQSFNACIILG